MSIQKISVFFNGKKIETAQRNLKKFMHILNIEEKSVAIAINSEFVPKRRYNFVTLIENDDIEIVEPFPGG